MLLNCPARCLYYHLYLLGPPSIFSSPSPKSGFSFVLPILQVLRAEPPSVVFTHFSTMRKGHTLLGFIPSSLLSTHWSQRQPKSQVDEEIHSGSVSCPKWSIIFKKKKVSDFILTREIRYRRREGEKKNQVLWDFLSLENKVRVIGHGQRGHEQSGCEQRGHGQRGRGQRGKDAEVFLPLHMCLHRVTETKYLYKERSYVLLLLLFQLINLKYKLNSQCPSPTRS